MIQEQIGYEDVNPVHCEVDISLLNSPYRLRERADAIDAWIAGGPVDKFVDGKWIELESQTAFFFDRRYRSRPVAPSGDLSKP